MHNHYDSLSALPKSRATSPEHNIQNRIGEDSSIFQTPDSTKRKSNNDRLKRSSTISSSTSSRSPARTHLRSLSITSTSSNIPNSNVNSARKGINIGINFVPQGTGVIKDKEGIESKTPRRKLFPITSTQMNTPSRLSSPVLYNNQNVPATSHAIEAQIMTPEHLDDLGQRSSLETNSSDISSMIGSSPTPQLPPIATDRHSADYDDLSEKFRLLAAKEMEILEIKNQVKELLQRKQDREFELQQLKVNIEKQLMSNLKQQNTENHRRKYDQHIPKSPSNVQKRILRPTNSTVDPLVDDSFIPISSDNVVDTSSPNSTDKRQSWFSKPFTFIQQLDNIVYKELGKLQLDDTEAPLIDPDYGNNTQATRPGQQHQKQQLQRNEEKEINAPIKSLAFESTPSGSDVMQTVSQHLWSFVNDVRSNLLVDEEETDLRGQNKLAHTSPSREGQSKAASSRVRTASISKRQSYNQHNIHKKRPSMNIVRDAVNSGKVDSDQDSIGDELSKDNITDVVDSISKNRVNVDEVKSTTKLKSHFAGPKNLYSTTVVGSLDGIIDDNDLWESEEQLDL
jgi:hypothetical protein